ncbi:MAG: hypothetical protein FWC76_02555 [Defluviitaleaceae bacterium]|nr:hypothetical protein [Defluviitaleaceae bacterium]
MKFRVIAVATAAIMLFATTGCGTGNLANNAYGLNRTNNAVVRDGHVNRGHVNRGHVSRNYVNGGHVGRTYTGRTASGSTMRDHGYGRTATQNHSRAGVGRRLGNALHSTRNAATHHGVKITRGVNTGITSENTNVGHHFTDGMSNYNTGMFDSSGYNTNHVGNRTTNRTTNRNTNRTVNRLANNTAQLNEKATKKVESNVQHNTKTAKVKVAPHTAQHQTVKAAPKATPKAAPKTTAKQPAVKHNTNVAKQPVARNAQFTPQSHAEKINRGITSGAYQNRTNIQNTVYHNQSNVDGNATANRLANNVSRANNNVSGINDNVYGNVVSTNRNNVYNGRTMVNADYTGNYAANNTQNLRHLTDNTNGNQYNHNHRIGSVDNGFRQDIGYGSKAQWQQQDIYGNQPYATRTGYVTSDSHGFDGTAVKNGTNTARTGNVTHNNAQNTAHNNAQNTTRGTATHQATKAMPKTASTAKTR